MVSHEEREGRAQAEVAGLALREGGAERLAVVLDEQDSVLLQRSRIAPRSPAKPSALVMKNAFSFVFLRVSARLAAMQLSVWASQSTGTAFMPSWSIGMTLVDQVSAEKPTLSPSFRRPRFLRACRRARLALPPLLKSTQCFRPCSAAKAFSNCRHFSPMLRMRACMMNSVSSFLVSYSLRKVFFISGIIFRLRSAV